MICRVFSFFIVVDEDDEEVFIGLIGFIEKCVVIVVLEIVFFQEFFKFFSFLKFYQIVEIFKEVQLVVYRINNEEKDEEGKGFKREFLGRRGRVQISVKYQRKGIFIESLDVFIRFLESVVKVMFVIDIEINDFFEIKVEENKENFYNVVISRLVVFKSRILLGIIQFGKGQVGFMCYKN